MTVFGDDRLGVKLHTTDWQRLMAHTHDFAIIAFRRDVLLRFNHMSETRLERIESVDMNRVLETGGRIRMVLTEAITIGVDTPQELQYAEVLMKDDLTLSQYI